MSEVSFIWPRVNQLWPPEGDNRVTNMDVVFFSDLEDARTAPQPWKLGETWVQKGHPEVCWPQQWLPEDLGNNVRIFEIRPWFRLIPYTRITFEEEALHRLDVVAKRSLQDLCDRIFMQDKDGQGSSLVFVGHGYGSLVLKQTLVKLDYQSGLYKDLRSNLCGIVFYGGTNTMLTNTSWSWRFFKNFQSILNSLMSKSLKYRLSKSLKDRLLEVPKYFEAALDLKKVKVCVVNKNKSFLQEIKDYSDLECQFSEVMDSNDSCTPTSKKDPSYYTLLEFLQQFLPKGLHQTIDDKKGREIRLRLSEPKDEEALGDMETASTSTKENRY